MEWQQAFNFGLIIICNVCQNKFHRFYQCIPCKLNKFFSLSLLVRGFVHLKSTFVVWSGRSLEAHIEFQYVFISKEHLLSRSVSRAKWTLKTYNRMACVLGQPLQTVNMILSVVISDFLSLKFAIIICTFKVNALHICFLLPFVRSTRKQQRKKRRK